MQKKMRGGKTAQLIAHLWPRFSSTAMAEVQKKKEKTCKRFVELSSVGLHKQRKKKNYFLTFFFVFKLKCIYQFLKTSAIFANLTDILQRIHLLVKIKF